MYETQDFGWARTIQYPKKARQYTANKMKHDMEEHEFILNSFPILWLVLFHQTTSPSSCVNILALHIWVLKTLSCKILYRTYSMILLRDSNSEYERTFVSEETPMKHSCKLPYFIYKYTISSQFSHLIIFW